MIGSPSWRLAFSALCRKPAGPRSRISPRSLSGSARGARTISPRPRPSPSSCFPRPGLRRRIWRSRRNSGRPISEWLPPLHMGRPQPGQDGLPLARSAKGSSASGFLGSRISAIAMASSASKESAKSFILAYSMSEKSLRPSKTV